MPIPGVPTGENHSAASQTLGRNRMPRRARVSYRRSTAAWTRLHLIETSRSRSRRSRSCASVQEDHGAVTESPFLRALSLERF